MKQAAPPRLKKRLAAIAGARLDRVNWDEVETLGRERSGIPVRVTVRGNPAF